MKIKFWLIHFIFCLLFWGCKKDKINNSIISSSPFQKHIGGPSDDVANSVIIANETLYVLGQTKSFEDANGDHYVIKLDLDGNVISEKNYGGNSVEEGIKIIATKDGNFIIIGTTESYGAGKEDIHVLKINPKGTVIWEKTFGGVLDDKPTDIIETRNYEFCIVGTTESFGAGANDIYVIWIDQNGNLIREKTFGGSDIDGGSGIKEIENGELMLFGFTRNFGAVSRDFYLIKLTPTGDALWSKRYGGEGYEESQCFARTKNGEFLLGGHSSSTEPNHDMYIVKVDSNSNQIWENNFGGDLHDGGESLLINKEGNYVLIARTMSFGNGSRNIYMVVTEPNGNIISEKILGGPQNDWGKDIIEYESFYFIAGHTNSFSTGDNDVYLIKIAK